MYNRTYLMLNIRLLQLCGARLWSNDGDFRVRHGK